VILENKKGEAKSKKEFRLLVTGGVQKISKVSENTKNTKLCARVEYKISP